MSFKQRCTAGVIAGVVLEVAAFTLGFFATMNTALVTPAVILAAIGAIFGRRSIRGLICISVFEKAKAKELEKLEAIFSGGGISQEDYYSKKIALLNTEYDDS
ncbi:MAG: hypothetical protein NC299_01945 [Lachnospiraceae bacterium]|nr:hypothetical protein [Ruminococcus sp.]MCM1274111.1 hypothetical protein [Lachnospiraceae bacterium]